MNTKKSKCNLYLIPNKLGTSIYSRIFPDLNKKIILSIKKFIIEDIRYGRRFLMSIGYTENFEDVSFYILNEHTKSEEIFNDLEEIADGENIGLLSDSGMPCIADPGNIVVQWAHQKDIKVIPLVGPSSIFLALAGSGLNGQSFTFNGYLPINKINRNQKLKELNNKVLHTNQTQIFIETPYRNIQMFESIIKTCSLEISLCIACDITLKNEYIKTKSIFEWKKYPPPIQKRPTVFLLGS